MDKINILCGLCLIVCAIWYLYLANVSFEEVIMVFEMMSAGLGVKILVDEFIF